MASFCGYVNDYKAKTTCKQDYGIVVGATGASRWQNGPGA